MKKIILSSAFVIVGFSLTSCRETEKKTDEPSVIVIEKKADDTPKKTEGTLEKAGRAIDNAAKEVKEAGKAVDKAAKEVVGDDN
ncbi:hypothetical protein [Gelidibacter sp.]|uniref:hypothetical protein n=1 Tax=Gelidibacter sp. TaxID=2018083 RepID=UPI0032678440